MDYPMTTTPPDNSEYKTCYVCNETKPLREYGKCTRYKSGLLNMCRLCKNAERRRSYERCDKEITKARTAKWYANNRQRITDWRRPLQRSAYKTKGRARYAVKKALTKGELVKLPCEVCGDSKVFFHHTNGYDEQNWLVGRWLCRQHHEDAHKEMRWQTTSSNSPQGEEAGTV